MMGLFLHTTSAIGAGPTSSHQLLANGVAPIANAAVMRRDNRGVWTTALLFLPLAAASFVEFKAPFAAHPVSLTLVIGLHGLIVLTAMRRPAAHNKEDYGNG